MVDYNEEDLWRATRIVQDLRTEEGRLRHVALEDGLSIADLAPVADVLEYQ